MHSCIKIKTHARTGCVYVVWFWKWHPCQDFWRKAEVSKEEFLKDFFKSFKVSKRFQSSKRSRTSQVSHKVLCREIQRCFTERGMCRSSNQVIPGLASSHCIVSCHKMCQAEEQSIRDALACVNSEA